MSTFLYEEAILTETRNFLRQFEKLNQSLMTINEPDMARLIEQLRSMEKDLLPIYTYFKNAVYTTNKDESSTNRPPLYD